MDEALIEWEWLSDGSPRAIAAFLGRLISEGRIADGTRLPTVRDVAAELGVSPATVSTAWQALRRAGLIEARGRSGSFARAEAAVPREPVRYSPRVAGLVGSLETLPLDLSRGTPDPGLLPTLTAALGRVSVVASTSVYQEDPALPALREALAATWPAEAEAITVVDGAQDGVARALEQVVGFGDRVAVENPGFPPFLDVLTLMGAEIVPLSVDREGVVPASLERALSRRIAAVVLQPRAQNPVGHSMSAERAAGLAALLAGHPGVTVIEDDHSSAIAASPEVTLAAHLPEQVVHVRGFSKSHGPELRIAAVGGPAALIDRIARRRLLGPSWTSRILQTMLVDLLGDPAAVTQVTRARHTYLARQRTLVDLLAESGLDVPAPDGINLWLPVADERAALIQLATRGIRAASGAPFMVAGTEAALGPHIRATTGVVAEERVPEVAAALAEAAAVTG